jgi:hypothetical protein
MPSSGLPAVTKRQSAMTSLRASATIIVLRVSIRLLAVRARYHNASVLCFENRGRSRQPTSPWTHFHPSPLPPTWRCVRRTIRPERHVCPGEALVRLRSSVF